MSVEAATYLCMVGVPEFTGDKEILPRDVTLLYGVCDPYSDLKLKRVRLRADGGVCTRFTSFSFP